MTGDTQNIDDLVNGNPLRYALAVQNGLLQPPDASGLPATSRQGTPPPQVIPPVPTVEGMGQHPTPTVTPSPLSSGRLALTHPETAPSVPGINPQQYRPSLQEVASNPQTGMPGQINPAETKLGKLVHILAGAAQGALAGWGTGNPGAGAQMAREVPFQEAQQRGQLAMQAAEMQPIQTPYGTLPAALAPKILSPYLQYEGKREVQGMKGNTAEDIEKQKAASAQSVANINKRFITVPGVGVYDTAQKDEKSGAPALIPGTSNSIMVTPEFQAENSDVIPKEFIGTRIDISKLSGANRASAFQNVPQMTEQGPIVVNRKNATAKPVTGPGGQRYGPPALASPMVVGDQTNPGQTKVVSGGTAIAQGAPGTESASVTVPRQAAMAEVPTKIGDQKVAFTTMIQHADLLRRAAKALNNGDPQTLQALENAFKNEFNYSGPITATAIADAYKGEVSNVINKGHITDTGNEKIAHTLDPSRQDYKTVDSVLAAYQALAQSKMNMLNQQQQAAVKNSQPKKKGEANSTQNVTAEPEARPSFAEWKAAQSKQ